MLNAHFLIKELMAEIQVLSTALQVTHGSDLQSVYLHESHANHTLRSLCATIQHTSLESLQEAHALNAHLRRECEQLLHLYEGLLEQG